MGYNAFVFALYTTRIDCTAAPSLQSFSLTQQNRKVGELGWESKDNNNPSKKEKPKMISVQGLAGPPGNQQLARSQAMRRLRSSRRSAPPSIPGWCAKDRLLHEPLPRGLSMKQYHPPLKRRLAFRFEGTIVTPLGSRVPRYLRSGS